MRCYEFTMRVWCVWRVCVWMWVWGDAGGADFEVRGVCRAGTGSESMCCVCMRYAGRRWWMRTKREAIRVQVLCEVQQVCV